MKTLSKRFINEKYQEWGTTILEENKFIKSLPREKGKPTKYEELKTLPSWNEFKEFLDKRFAISVSEALSSACSEVDCLKDELQDWFDNLPEQFQSGDKGSQLEEAISQMDNITEPDIPECLNDVNFVHIPSINPSSRSSRCFEVISLLESTAQTINDFLEGLEDKEASDENKENIDSTAELRDTVEEMINDLQSVEFPGMY